MLGLGEWGRNKKESIPFSMHPSLHACTHAPVRGAALLVNAGVVVVGEQPAGKRAPQNVQRLNLFFCSRYMYMYVYMMVCIRGFMMGERM